MEQSEPRGGERRLAALLRERRDEIISAWERAARILPAARELDRPTLRDDIPALLDRLIEQADRSPGVAPSPAPVADEARAHAGARLSIGFDLAEVTAEYALLREVLVTVLERAPSAIQPDERRLVHRALDEAIGEAVSHYQRASARGLAALDRLSSLALTSLSDRDTLLERLVELVVESSETVDTAAVFVVERDRLRARAAVGLSAEARDLLASRVGEGFVGTIAAERRPLSQRAALQELGVRALHGVPLAYDDRVIGVLVAGSRDAPELPAEERHLVRMMADRAALALALGERAHELRASEQRFRATFDLASVGIAHAALDGTWLRTNRRLSEILGYSPDELRTLTFQAITHPDDLASDVHASERLVAGDIASFSLEKRYIRKDGSIVWGHMSVALVRPEGEEPFFVTVVADITDRRRALEALERSERRYALATAATRDAIWEWDFVSGEVHWGESIHTVFGYTTDEVGADAAWWIDHIHPDERQDVLDSVERTIRGADEEWTHAYRFRRRDGGYANVLDHAVIERDRAGRALRAIGSMRDVTEHKRVERERELQLGVLGHDLRNPLAAIGAAADLMLRRGHLDERDAASAQRIKSSVARMARLVTNLLEFSRARAGTLTVARRPADLAEVASAPIDELRAAHPGRTVTLERRGDTAGEIDPDRLAQVVSNLVGNALAHGLPTAPVSILITGGGGELVLSIHNEGAPIPDALRGHLFDPFAVGKQGGRSVGLGLYIVERIVAAHGGSIDVESTASAGTTFRVRIPRVA